MAAARLRQMKVGDQMLLTDPAGAETVSVVEVGLDSEGDPMLVVIGPGGRRRTVDMPSVLSAKIQLSDNLKLTETHLRGASYTTAKTGWTRPL